MGSMGLHLDFWHGPVAVRRQCLLLCVQVCDELYVVVLHAPGQGLYHGRSVCSTWDRFTRLSGELFGFLIALLFMQQAIKGVRNEFLAPIRQPVVRWACDMFSCVLWVAAACICVKGRLTATGMVLVKSIAGSW